MRRCHYLVAAGTTFVAAVAIGATVSRHQTVDHPAGALNPDVTQGTISTTICVPNWTATVRPPTSYTNRLKATQMATLGLPGKPGDYEEDHRIPLALGGAPRDPVNLWPEPIADARKVDVLERRLQVSVCAGRQTLFSAQVAIRNAKP